LPKKHWLYSLNYAPITKEHGDTKLDEVALRQITGGASGIKMMLWETSQIDATKGIRFRDTPSGGKEAPFPADPRENPSPKDCFG
jgi:citrate synthase